VLRADSYVDVTSAGPLEGIRVTDVTTVLMGPLATRILADLGADVVKVEPPGGDPFRHIGPSRSPGMGWNVFNLLRNKRSAALDLRQPDDYAALLDIVRSSDVFLTNMRSSACARLGVGFDDLVAVKPDLVYCIANGFDSSSPFRDKAAYDDVIQAMSGIASLPTWSGSEPRYFPSVICDKIAALHIVYAVLAALIRRQRTGLGEHIEVPMAECLAALNLVENMSGATFVPPLGPYGYARMRNPTRRPHRAADGWVCILPYSDENWSDFFDLAGAPELATDERFATRAARDSHADELNEWLLETTPRRTVSDWVELCDTRSVPAAPVVALEEIEENPYFRGVGLLTTVEHPSEGSYTFVRDAVKFASGSGGLRRHAPRIGQHTQEILGEVRPGIDGIRGG
jgi:crotonobetainyl-CoA:carnitine CoA-transferase CaiB-like acyl-CoA transferase